MAKKKSKKKNNIFSKLIKKFKKLDSKIRIGITAAAAAVVLIILIVVVSEIMKKIKVPSVNEMFSKFISQYNTSTEYEESVSIVTNTKINLNYSGIITEDYDTTYMNLIYADKSKELYVDTLDRKYQIYLNNGSGWTGYVASKYTAIDDDRTDYIEKDNLTTSETLETNDIHNGKVIKNSDGTFDLSFEATYNKAESLLGQTIFAIYNSDEYKELKPFFSMYKDDIKVRITAHFSSSKKLLAWKIESDAELAKTANEFYGVFNLTELKIIFNNLTYEPKDVYVPISVDVEAFK